MNHYSTYVLEIVLPMKRKYHLVKNLNIAHEGL